MDITLNICNNPNDSTIGRNKANSIQKTKTKKSSSSPGFSFTFTKNDKVKAVVARKRLNRPNSIKSTEKQEPKIEIKKTDTEEEIPTQGKFVLRRPSISDDDDGGKQNHVEDDKVETDLKLNISKEIPLDIIKLRKQKLSKEERRKLKYEKKIKQRTFDKVLTPEELKDGIKKFSEISAPKKKTENMKKHIVKDVNLFKNSTETKIFGQRLVKPVTEKVFTGVSISSLNLHPHCVKNLSDILNISELTTVQQMTIPKALEGKDCLVRSQTGSGKTLAYALPIVQKLQEIRPKLTRDCGIQAVIIVPTRELVIQTYELFVKLLKPFTWLVPGMLTGGEKRKAEKARLRKGITILIGTPGRLCDHLLHTESFKLDKVKFLVLDEADRLLEFGYELDVKRIVEAIDNHKAGRFTNTSTNTNIQESNNVNDNDNVKPSQDLQRLLLSATLTSAVQKLAGLTLKDPLFIDTSDENATNNVITENNFENAVEEAVVEAKLVIPETVQLNYVIVPPKLRLVTLSSILVKECKNKKVKILIFMSTMEMVNFHNDLFNEALTNKVLDEEDEPNDDDENDDEPLLEGIKFFRLHGSMTQQERTGVFKTFKEIKGGILLATNVAGRGIDVPEVDLVIQYSPPQEISEFVHSVGRTGRAGRNGRAILFLAPNETEFVRILEDKRIRISQSKMETYFDELFKTDSVANTAQEAASNLQYKFEKLIYEDKEMHGKACKAFVSWVRSYSAFPKDLKHIFNAKTAHMGHFAKSFGLREPPKSFAKEHNIQKAALPTNRLTYTDRSVENTKTMKNDKAIKSNNNFKKNDNKLKRYLQNSVALSTSEYDSGLPPLKKNKK